MIIRLALVVLSGVLIFTTASGQPPRRTTVPEYIQLYKNEAIKDMLKTGVPASITLAQGILESDAGNSDLAREANNHFGIKCHKGWEGPFFIKDDDEKDECFRKYPSAYESFLDHGRFLRERPRYAFLFDFEITDYKSWAHGLKKAGYATNPRYGDILIRIIEEHQLHIYDKMKDPITDQDPIAKNKTDSGKEEGLNPSEHHKKNDNRKTSRFQSSGQTKHGVPYIKASRGDSWYSIAIANDMRLWQILKYNDAEKNDVLREGDVVYLKPKRGRPDSKYHTVSQGESIRMIAQEYGVKTSRIIRLNNLENDIYLKPGIQLRLY